MSSRIKQCKAGRSPQGALVFRKKKVKKPATPAESSRSPKVVAHDWLDFVLERATWVPTVATGVLNLVGGIFLATIGDLETKDQIVRLVLGSVLLLAGLGIAIPAEMWRRALDKAQQSEVTQFTVAVTDVLNPMGTRIGKMIDTPSKNRKEALAELRSEVAHSVIHLFPDVSRLRVVVYDLSEDDTAMDPVYVAGRKDVPRSFQSGDKGRGDRAFAVLKGGDAIFENDYSDEKRSYKTYLNVRIAAGDVGYGVLTVDAPVAGSLSESDLNLVSLLATLLAIANAEALRK